ncbi:AI-2E family transporter [Neolewinella agarilytica]|uniref:Predicted PurR-regulated permease PerM n=1 Tax=Neolewinella agarilytica TaxID=478744 RepID=A0A1H9L290_9BACT|nr:AI-2E family transporter [Neolewinella agarilytica]SER05257.1 Predicted PurR-regulated permease PerM [Neolewinella agarilytica]
MGNKNKKKKKKSEQFSVERLAYFMICLSIVLAVLYLGSSFFIPLTYGMLFAFLLKPIRDWIERGINNRVVAILLSLSFVGLIISGVFLFFISQISEVVDRADNIMASLQDTGSSFMEWCGETMGYTGDQTLLFFEENFTQAIDQPLGILTSSLSTSGLILANLSLVVIYSFFFLLYSTAFKNFVLGQFASHDQAEGMETLREIQSVATDYLGGMVTVMVILGVLNSVGLFLIGVKYALVWGFLGALLAVIPYVGTTIGGLVPFIYAVATTDSYWQPIAVVILYATVQFVEGNFITPKVVGNSVKINALAAIVSLIFGALIWGVPGVIIAIPILAMVRIIMEHIPPLMPVALMLSDDLYEESDQFLTTYNSPEYRLSKLFLGRKLVRITDKLPLTGQPVNEVGKTDTQIVADAKAKQGNGNTSS